MDARYTGAKEVCSLESIDITWVDRIQHIHSRHRTSDEALAYAQSLPEQSAERITIATANEATEVTVYTTQAVLHFHTFRADYIGHASRTLTQLLAHFGVQMPIEFLVTHPFQEIDLVGCTITLPDSDVAYALGARRDGLALVEPVQWMIRSDILDHLLALADVYGQEPIALIEDLVRVLVERHDADDGPTVDPTHEEHADASALITTSQPRT